MMVFMLIPPEQKSSESPFQSCTCWNHLDLITWGNEWEKRKKNIECLSEKLAKKGRESLDKKFCVRTQTLPLWFYWLFVPHKSSKELAKILFYFSKIKTLTHEQRKFLSLLNLPFTLTQSKPNSILPQIEVLICLHEKDLFLLNVCLDYLIQMSKNQITKITIVTTPMGLTLISQLNMEHQYKGIEFSVQNENTLLPQPILLACEKDSRIAGWMKQQLIKIWTAYQSTAEWLLIIDVDTIILQETIWIDDIGNSSIFPNFHSGNSSNKFISLFPGLIYEETDYGFVSHFQLMKPQIVADFIAELQGKKSEKFTETSLSSSVTLMSKSCEQYSDNLRLEKSDQAVRVLVSLVEHLGVSFSEYDIYARYSLKRRDSKTIECFWSNTSIDLKAVQDVELVRKISQRLTKYYSSVSFHTHVLFD